MKLVITLLVLACALGAQAQSFTPTPDYRVRLTTNNLINITEGTGTTARSAFEWLDTWSRWMEAWGSSNQTLAQEAYNIAITSGVTVASSLTIGNLFVTNSLVVSNFDAKVSYMGYPKLPNSPITKVAGSGTHPSSYTAMVDTNLATYVPGTNTGGGCANYYMDLGEVHDGVIVIAASGEGSAGSGVVTLGSVISSTAVPLFDGTTKEPAGLSTWGSIDKSGVPLGTNGVQRIVSPFHGRYVGATFAPIGASSDCKYTLYEIAVYGVTNAWRNW